MPIAVKQILSNIYLPLSFYLSWAFPLLFWSLNSYTIHSSHVSPSPQMLYMYFSCSIYLSSFCITLLSFCACFVFPSFLGLQYRAWPQQHPYFYTFLLWHLAWYLRKSLCLVRFCSELYWILWLWEQSNGKCDAGGLSTLGGPSVCYYLFSTCCHHGRKTPSATSSCLPSSFWH